ncbi:hypothetical protein PI125_g21992 [Phytophthora idaei]|nr:hypothetical protein PI125_g21992 [Phytophthora idaei]KAG3130927.1 hypothetical protein PI126_g20281 [Phytophthora idaei]
MGFQKTMLLAVAFFVGSFAQPEQACGPEMTAPYVPNSLSTSTIAPSSKRFLRPYDTAAWDTVDSEEKAGASLLSKLDDLKQKISKFSSSVEKANIKARLKSQVHPSDLLGTLRLGNGTAKLDDNPNLVQWFRLVEAYRAKNGEQAFSNFDMYFLLLKTNSPEQLKTLPESLEKIPGLKKISESMKNWLKSPESPEKVFNDLRLAKANMDAFGDNSMLIQWFSAYSATENVSLITICVPTLESLNCGQYNLSSGHTEFGLPVSTKDKRYFCIIIAFIGEVVAPTNATSAALKLTVVSFDPVSEYVL